VSAFAYERAAFEPLASFGSGCLRGWLFKYVGLQRLVDGRIPLLFW
jgi:hypothetical protein